jgi:serine protease Do
MKKIFYTILIVLGCTVVLAGAQALMVRSAGTAERADVARPTAPTQALQQPAVSSSINSAKQISQAFVEVARKVTPSIVMIVNEEKLQNAMGDNSRGQSFPNDFFNNFFNFTPEQREQVQRTLGCGVILSSDGYIVTNNHVVDNSTKLQVTLPDGRRVTGKIVGKDAKTDLALIKVDADHLNALPLGHDKDIEVGEWVLAIGSPFGEALNHTVTSGIISAKGRSNVGIADYEDFLQTDAAINPGNSGGALVDLDGDLIGINTAILSSSGASAGIGFAIPVDMVRQITDQLKSQGHVVRGWLGVSIQALTPEMKKSLNLEKYDGAVVSDVQKGSPAAEAGFKSYDVITSVNGKTIRDNTQLRDEIAALRPGSKAEIGIVRDGKEKTISLTIGELKDEKPNDQSDDADKEGKLGMRLQSLNPEIADQLETNRTFGVVVTRVAPGSAAEASGLQQGDIIFEVDRKPVKTVSDFESMIKAAGHTGLLLAVDRQDRTFFITLDLS